MITIKEFSESNFEVLSPITVLKERGEHTIYCLSIARQWSCDYKFQDAKIIEFYYDKVNSIYLYYIPELNIASCVFMCQPLFYGTFYDINEVMIAFERSMKLYVKGFKL